MATELDEDSIPNAASPPECKEMMNGPGGDGPLTPMSDTTTVVLGDEVPEKTVKTDRKKKLEDVGQAKKTERPMAWRMWISRKPLKDWRMRIPRKSRRQGRTTNGHSSLMFVTDMCRPHLCFISLSSGI